MSTDYLKEQLEAVHAKGVMILDLLAKDHIKTINDSGLPCLVCCSSDYSEGYKKYGCKFAEGLVKKLYPKYNKSYYYKDAIAKGIKPDQVKDNGDELGAYLNGGGTTGKSKTIKITSKSINELVWRVSDLDEIKAPGEEAEVIVLPLFHCFGLCIGIHMAMCNSARIIPMMQFDAKIFTKLMRKNKVVGFGGIPLMFEKLMKDNTFYSVYKIPAGTYNLDMSEGFAEWTIDGTNSSYIEVDSNGNFIPDEEGIAISEVTLVIKDNYAELTAVIEGKTHFVTFSGKFARVDSTNEGGNVIRETTLIDDVEVESDTAMFIAVIEDDVAHIIATENVDDNGAAFKLQVTLADGSDSISGNYSVADGTLSTGSYNSEGILGSWYFNIVDGDLGYAYAAIQDGSVAFVQEGESCHMTLNCNDAEGYTIKATMSGMLYTESSAAQAMLTKFCL